MSSASVQSRGSAAVDGAAAASVAIALGLAAMTTGV